jgi:hypothetical protein
LLVAAHAATPFSPSVSEAFDSAFAGYFALLLIQGFKIQDSGAFFAKQISSLRRQL